MLMPTLERLEVPSRTPGKVTILTDPRNSLPSHKAESDGGLKQQLLYNSLKEETEDEAVEFCWDFRPTHGMGCTRFSGPKKRPDDGSRPTKTAIFGVEHSFAS